MASAEMTVKDQGLSKRDRERATTTYRALTAATLLVCALLVAYYLAASRESGVPAATFTGRMYGLAGLALFTFLALYGIRRYAYHAKIRLEWWYRAHLLLGLVGLTLLGCHSGFAIRSAFMGALQVSFWGVVLTGLFGWGYQSAFKAWMVRHEYRPTILRELDDSLAAVREKVEREIGSLNPEAVQAGVVPLQKLVAEVLERMRQTRLQHLWRFPDHTFWYEQVCTLLKKLGLNDLPQDLQLLIIELNHLEVLRWYHVVLRAWTTVHLWFTYFAVQMVLWHLWLVGRYPR
jgi:hypothetical protein